MRRHSWSRQWEVTGKERARKSLGGRGIICKNHEMGRNEIRLTFWSEEKDSELQVSERMGCFETFCFGASVFMSNGGAFKSFNQGYTLTMLGMTACLHWFLLPDTMPTAIPTADRRLHDLSFGDLTTGAFPGGSRWHCCLCNRARSQKGRVTCKDRWRS